jgi:hypothetical protein
LLICRPWPAPVLKREGRGQRGSQKRPMSPPLLTRALVISPRLLGETNRCPTWPPSPGRLCCGLQRPLARVEPAPVAEQRGRRALRPVSHRRSGLGAAGAQRAPRPAVVWQIGAPGSGAGSAPVAPTWSAGTAPLRPNPCRLCSALSART